jgi:hypothetical protein
MSREENRTDIDDLRVKMWYIAEHHEAAATLTSAQ